MEVELTRINDAFLFEGTNASGHKILFDSTIDAEPKGVSPMESVLMAVAACSGIDIVSILKKQQQEITALSAKISGERIQEDGAKPFKTIEVIFSLEGKIDLAKAKRAGDLSFNKYCSVSKTLEPKATVCHRIFVNGTEAL